MSRLYHPVYCCIRGMHVSRLHHPEYSIAVLGGRMYPGYNILDITVLECYMYPGCNILDNAVLEGACIQAASSWILLY